MGKRIMALAALAAGVALAGPALGALAGLVGRPQAKPPVSSMPALALAGKATGLYPGGSSPLWVRVKNRSPRPVTLLRIAVRIGDASPRCPATALQPGGFDGHLRIPPGGQRRVRMQAVMRVDAPAACAGATFPLRLRASGRWRR